MYMVCGGLRVRRGDVSSESLFISCTERDSPNPSKPCQRGRGFHEGDPDLPREHAQHIRSGWAVEAHPSHWRGRGRCPTHPIFK